MEAAGTACSAWNMVRSCGTSCRFTSAFAFGFLPSSVLVSNIGRHIKPTTQFSSPSPSNPHVPCSWPLCLKDVGSHQADLHRNIPDHKRRIYGYSAKVPSRLYTAFRVSFIIRSCLSFQIEISAALYSALRSKNAIFSACFHIFCLFDVSHSAYPRSNSPPLTFVS